MTKLEELKAAHDAAYAAMVLDTWRWATWAAAYAAYEAELKKVEGEKQND
jgi:hypothetical protein